MAVQSTDHAGPNIDPRVQEMVGELIATLHGKINDRDQKIKDLDERVNELQVKLQADYEKLQQQFQDTINELQGQIANKDDTIQHLEEQVHYMQNHTSELLERNKAHVEDIKALEHGIIRYNLSKIEAIREVLFLEADDQIEGFDHGEGLQGNVPARWNYEGCFLKFLERFKRQRQENEELKRKVDSLSTELLETRTAHG